MPHPVHVRWYNRMVPRKFECVLFKRCFIEQTCTSLSRAQQRQIASIKCSIPLAHWYLSIPLWYVAFSLMQRAGFLGSLFGHQMCRGPNTECFGPNIEHFELNIRDDAPISPLREVTKVKGCNSQGSNLVPPGGRLVC